MKSLLIRLNFGLYEVDISNKEKVLIKRWLDKKYVVKKDNLYKFHSKYRAGEIFITQNDNTYLRSIDTNVKDLAIATEDLAGAKKGDLVIVKRLLGKRGTPSAKVAEVVGYAKIYSVAFIALKQNRKIVLDIVSGCQIDINVDYDELDNYDVGIVFKIDNETSTIAQILGNLDDPLVDEKIVLAQHNKHDVFSNEIVKSTSLFDEVDISLYLDRVDLRHLPFCTIDPVTAKDFDDAIYFDVKNTILYIAIADVSEYVKPFDIIDIEAIYRSFSIYLPHRSIPMLPRELSETLCSLQPNVDRLSYVFKLHIDIKSLEVIKSDIFEAVIHSKRRFNYDEIDNFLQGDFIFKNEHEKELFDYIIPLQKLTARLKIKRLQTGFDFRLDEIEMILDKNGEISSTLITHETASHSLIEDCMLLANKAAALMYEKGIFRVHESPSQSKIQSLYNELAGIGIFVEPKETMRETISLIQKQARDKGLGADVDMLIIGSQKRARYSPDNYGHFGLGFDKYTHFTSPIRRYSDLITHRFIKAIKANDTKQTSYVLRNIESLTLEISQKERESADVQFRFMDRKFARWAKNNIGKIFQARIEATDPYLIAKLDDKIKGATLHVKSQIPVMLFNVVEVMIQNVDIATTKIDVIVIKNLQNV